MRPQFVDHPSQLFNLTDSLILLSEFVNIPCHKRTANLAFEDPKKATSLYAVDPETGKKKMNIEFIEDRPKRNITFSKRKAGIMKKAFELSTLTGSEGKEKVFTIRPSKLTILHL